MKIRSHLIHIEREQDEDRYVRQEFKIVGVIQIRQFRVRKDACVVPSRVQGIVTECVATYRKGRQDIAQYGPVTSDGTRQFQFQVILMISLLIRFGK